MTGSAHRISTPNIPDITSQILQLCDLPSIVGLLRYRAWSGAAGALDVTSEGGAGGRCGIVLLQDGGKSTPWCSDKVSVATVRRLDKVTLLFVVDIIGELETGEMHCTGFREGLGRSRAQ